MFSSHFFLPSVWSCRVVLLLVSPGHIIGLIVPANSNLVHSELGLRPERMHYGLGFIFFPFVLFLSSPFLSFFASCAPFFALLCIVLSFPSFSVVRTYLVRTTAMLLVLSRSNDTGSYTTGRYSSAPLRTGTTVQALLCFFPRDVYCSLFCDHGVDFRK